MERAIAYKILQEIIMAFSLYDASVANFLQTLGAVSGFLDKGIAHCREKAIALDDVVDTKLAPDMLPLRFQIVSVAHHSRGAIEGIQKGLFMPPSTPPNLDYAGLQAWVSEASTALSSLKPEAVNSLEGKDVMFQLVERKWPF